MAPALRALLPVVGGALLPTALLVLWIRLEPIDLSRVLQVLLSLLLVLAAGVLSAAVLRVERDTEAQDHVDGE